MESRKKILKEETIGVDTFLNDIDSIYNISGELYEKIKLFIENSDCKKIEFADFKSPVMGVALHNGVLINEKLLKSDLEFLLFIIFHEIAHQYQYKKYGEQKMYECYLGEISDNNAAVIMKNTEIVADEFATRKIREFQKYGLINPSYKPNQMYKNTPVSVIASTIEKYRKMMKQENIDTPEKISEFFYNSIKNTL